MSIQEDTLDEILDGIQSTNQNKAPTSFIGDYAVLELLGSGGFGSVYKVKKKKSGQSFLAMKEVKYATAKHTSFIKYNFTFQISLKKKLIFNFIYSFSQQINALMPEMGKNAKERNKSIGDLISELNIIREQLRHPNVVRYYKTFEESKFPIVFECNE